jgi:hypothetical protein
MTELNNGKYKKNDLFGLLQNDMLGAIALHSFTLGYYSVAKHKEDKLDFPLLKYMFFVLPIVYNYASLTIFLSSNEVYTALYKDPTIRLGLQERANKMSSQTFDALNIAFSKRILGYDKGNSTIILLKPFTNKKLVLPLSLNTVNSNVKSIQNCAYKFGSIFAKRNEKNIQQELNILL